MTFDKPTEGRAEQQTPNTAIAGAASEARMSGPISFAPSSSNAHDFLPAMQLHEGGSAQMQSSSGENLNLHLGAPQPGEQYKINFSQNPNGSDTLRISERPVGGQQATAGSEGASMAPQGATSGEATSLAPQAASNSTGSTELSALASPSADNQTNSSLGTLANLFGQQDQLLAANPGNSADA